MNLRTSNRAWFPVLAVTVSMVALVTIKTGRDAVFLSASRLEDLPLGYLLITLASVPAAMFHLKAMRWWGTRRTRVLLITLLSLTFAGLVPFVTTRDQSTATILFVIVPVAFAAIFASVWLLAADLLEDSTSEVRRRAYTWMGLGSMIGGLAGGLNAKLLSYFVSPRFFVLTGALLLAVVAWIITRAHRTYPTESGPSWQGNSAGPDVLAHSWVLVRNPYILGLIGLSSMVALGGLLVEFQFYAFTMLTGRTNTGFFANFYTLLNVAGLGLQVFAGSWIQSRFGTGIALLILPVGLLGGSVVVFLHATLVTRAGLRILESGLKSSTHRFAWEQTYLPIKGEHRDVVKALVDGLFARMAEGVGAGALLIWFSLGSSGPEGSLNLSLFSWAIAFCVLFWIYLVFYLLGRGCGRSRKFDEMFRLPDG